MSTKYEEWRTVAGYEGYYEVSSLGRVRSLTRTLIQSDGKTKTFIGQVLKASLNSTGRLKVDLLKGGSRTIKVHRLVALAFHGEPTEGHEACHNDGNPLNNRAENLRWDTRSANSQDSIKHNTHRQASKTHCPRGHQLAAPNLSAANLKSGTRTCLACARTRNVIRRAKSKGISVDVQSISDSYYIEIIERGAA